MDYKGEWMSTAGYNTIVNFMMWGNRVLYSFARSVQPMPVQMMTAVRSNLLLSSISNFQMHNLVKFISQNQLAEQGLSDKLTAGLLSLLSQSLPLINLASQICSITGVRTRAP
jgi:hypothetical protein